ncbi:MAG: hypothetical protein AB7P03_08695 [Kofleriaceae bacterium]
MPSKLILIACKVALATSVVFVTGCFAPQAVVRWHPDDPAAVWRDGRGIMTRNTPDARIAVAFESLEEGRVAVVTEVENTSSKTLDVDPRNMSYAMCTEQRNCFVSAPVIDPERSLVAMDVARSQERADQKNTEALGTTVAVLQTAGAVAATVSGDLQEGAEMASDAADTAQRTDDSSARSEEAIATIEVAKRELVRVALRRTTLFPGERVSGLVFIPVDDRADSIWLRVRIGTTTVAFPFRQQVFSAEPPRKHRY